jgi:hypothetical protein
MPPRRRNLSQSAQAKRIRTRANCERNTADACVGDRLLHASPRPRRLRLLRHCPPLPFCVRVLGSEKFSLEIGAIGHPYLHSSSQRAKCLFNVIIMAANWFVHPDVLPVVQGKLQPCPKPSNWATPRSISCSKTHAVCRKRRGAMGCKNINRSTYLEGRTPLGAT